MKRFAISLFFIVLTAQLHAQYVLDFELKNATTGKTAAVVPGSATKGVVYIFMGVDCPYSTHYIARLSSLSNEFSNRGIALVWVNSFTNQDGEELKKQAGEASIYLIDDQQRLKKMLGARKSPEAFLLRNDGGKFTRFYAGPIDNNPQVAADVKEHYLRKNIENLLAGKPAEKSKTPVIGCVIK